MLTLQKKLTAALLFTGLASTLVLGAIAHWMLMRDFRETLMDEAFDNFRADMVAYVESHPQWTESDLGRDFSDFVRHRRRPMGGPGGFRRPPPDVSFKRAGTPPFRFIVMDPDGRIVKGSEALPVGAQAPADTRASARPIEVDGRLVLLASPDGEPVLTRRDQDYLDAMRKALFTGMGVAVGLSLLFGLMMGRRMSRSLQTLTRAIRDMQTNRELPRHVPVRSGDEIGELARAFNDMNAELTQAHRELREYAELAARQSERLKELSIRDALTGLYNRRHFDEHAGNLYQQALRYGQPLAVMIGDLDCFKQINDVFSHAIGDEVLRRIAALLREGTRKADLVSRYGGEEFVILFPSSTLEQAAQCCEKLRQAIEAAPWHEIHPDLQVTMSMGLSARLESGSVDGMIADADEQLYRAKHGGRNRVLPPPAQAA
ncbi:diguanylate cyclase [Nitrogeniibacter mangrovi]|uniref:diguanylate cyclase n=1 Tax=Nitrogeniibacter mangrovi TaxID=2016596 RepID=A0A6C1B6E1_9RHOO|nr:diguanylate cyclase [Nitrogeniibacter mangrovi]QID18609.1 diguanylate cyclase [Nitrogeniibacter mangrovi]